jgi:hypothetical protein
MIEYLYDAVKASKGQDITLAAEITDEDGAQIVEDCELHLFNPDKEMIATIEGVYESEEWRFTIPKEATADLKGRCWYCIGHNGNSLCFKQPIYFV